MGIMRFNYRSQAIGGYIDISVAYPTDHISYYDVSKGARHHDSAGDKPFVYEPGMKFQTVYLLHGGGDDDSLTYRYTNAERYAQKHQVMLVTPGMMNSFGVDTAYGVAYSTFLTEELPVVIRSLFASSPRREDNFLMGYAMGGNAALGTALLRPDLFSVCMDISGGIGMTMNRETLQAELVSDHFKNWFPLYCATFGSPEAIPASRFDLKAIAQRHLDAGVKLPKLYVLAGGDEPDFIFNRIQADADTLKAMGMDVDYRCYPGYKHDFAFWDYVIRHAFETLLPLRNAPIYPGE